MSHVWLAELKIFTLTMREYLFDEQHSEEIAGLIKQAEIVTKWPLILFLISALGTFSCSFSCHWFLCRNEKVWRFVHKLDHAGIALTIIGSTYPGVMYKYACGPFIIWRFVFLAFSACMLFLTMYFTLQDGAQSEVYRVILFLSFAVACAIPWFTILVWHDPMYTV